MENAHQSLSDLRNGLIRLHKTLLDSERAVYERDVERIPSAGRMLQLVMGDPYFAWLHKVSELIVAIDERLDTDDDPVGPADAGGFLAATRNLLLPAAEGADFARRYHQAMQRDPDVVIAHGRMMAVLNSLT
jgi:hypothetical protein